MIKKIIKQCFELLKFTLTFGVILFGFLAIMYLVEVGI